jgi:hypothetical protein
VLRAGAAEIGRAPKPSAHGVIDRRAGMRARLGVVDARKLISSFA